MLNIFTLLKSLSVLLGRLVLSCGYLKVILYQLCRNFHLCFKGKIVFSSYFFKLVCQKSFYMFRFMWSTLFIHVENWTNYAKNTFLGTWFNFCHSCHVALLFCKWHFTQNKVSQWVWMTKKLSSGCRQEEGWQNTILKKICIFYRF